MKKKPEIILFDGVSGVGKSKLLEFIKNTYKEGLFVGTKQTTRRKRESDNDWEFEFVDQISDSLELSFTSVGNQYSIDKIQIDDKVRNGVSYVVSCTDITTIQRIKSYYETTVIYIYRNLSLNEFSNLILSKDSLGSSSMNSRADEYSELLVKYSNHIDLYDHVILNIGSSSSFLYQLKKILEHYGFES